MKLLVVAIAMFLTATLASAQSDNILRQIYLNRIKEVRRLVEENPLVLNAREPVSRRTPLMIAAGTGNLEIVKYLVSKGARLDSVDVNNHTALYIASTINHKDIARCLLDAGAQMEFLAAVILGDTEEVKKALQQRSGFADSIDVNINKPIVLAARNNDIEVMRVLLKHGANVNTRLKDGDLLIHYAARNDRLGQLRLLLEHGAEVDVRNIKDETPLQVAAEFSSVEMVQHLLNSKADPSLKDWMRRSPFHRALRANMVDIIELLIPTVERINDISDEGAALHIAIWSHGNVEVVKRLLELGADVYLRDTRADTPLKLARRYGHEEIAALLEEAGAFE